MIRAYNQLCVPRMSEACKECGCKCHICLAGNSLDLHHEIEELRSKLIKSQNQISQTERDLNESREYSENEISKLQDELSKLRDRYDRLYESHKKLQRLNHNLEDKLLILVGQFNTEKTSLSTNVDNLSKQLRDARILICDLEEECEKYRADCNTAVHLLQNDPAKFVSHEFSALPLDLQQRVKCHLTREELQLLEETGKVPPSPKMIRVPMPTFPPTAMVYSIERPFENNLDTQSKEESKTPTIDASLIARVLLQPETNRKTRRVYICQTCQKDYMFFDVSTQTVQHYTDNKMIHRQASSNKYPQSAILIQPSVHGDRERLNSTETEL